MSRVLWLTLAAAEATGTLESYVVEPPAPGEPIAASRGPGTYYALRVGDGLAKAR